MIVWTEGGGRGEGGGGRGEAVGEVGGGLQLYLTGMSRRHFMHLSFNNVDESSCTLGPVQYYYLQEDQLNVFY